MTINNLRIQLWIDLATQKISTVKPLLENRHVHMVDLAHTFDAALIVSQLRAIADFDGKSISNDIIKVTIEIPNY